MEIRLLGVPTRAESVQISVDTGQSRYAASVDIAAFDGRVHVSNVPVGSRALIHAEALMGGTMVAARETQIEVVSLTVVTLDLQDHPVVVPGTDGGVSEPRSARSGPLPFRARGLRNSQVSGGRLDVELQGNDSGIFQSFVSAAGDALGATPASFALAEATVTLEGEPHHVNSLSDLWTGPLELGLSTNGGASIVVARLATVPNSSGPAPMAMVGDRTTLAPLMTALLDQSFRIHIGGATPQNGEDDFDADVRFSLDFAAYAE